MKQIIQATTNDVNSQFPSYNIGPRKVPQILALAASRVEQWSEHSWKWLSKLRDAIHERVFNGKRISTRTMRKEQRESITALLRVLLSYLDLGTMQIGIFNPKTGVFVHLTLAYLARQANLSFSQAQRAMAWLYDSGYVIGYRQSSFDMDTNEFFYKPSIRKISNHLLTDLGITDLALSRARARSKKTIRQTIGKAVTDVVKAAKEIKKACSTAFKSINSTQSKKTMSLTDYAEKLNKIMDLIPGISIDDAKKMLPNPLT